MKKLQRAEGAQSRHQRAGDIEQAVRSVPEQAHVQFSYDAVGQLQVGAGWLQPAEGASPEDQQSAAEYRRNLFGALKAARARYVARVRSQGGVVPASLAAEAKLPDQLKTVDPEIPDFATARNALHKFSGVCIKTQYKRFFSVDAENFRYYMAAEDNAVQKYLKLLGSEAFLQSKTDFKELLRVGKIESGDEWADPDLDYRVGIKLKGRGMKPIFFYSDRKHDAKVLLTTIKLYSIEKEGQ